MTSDANTAAADSRRSFMLDNGRDVIKTMVGSNKSVCEHIADRCFYAFLIAAMLYFQKTEYLRRAQGARV